MNESWRTRITIESGKRGGRPCIRGMRITVYDVLSNLAAGMAFAEILNDFPYLTAEDIQACLAYAAERDLERIENVAAIQKGLDDFEAGRSMTLDEFKQHRCNNS
jgi:uncharacterized protein (DUF433 family)